MENQKDLQENYLKVLERVELGSRVSGAVVNIMKDYVLVDIGYKSEGFIKIEEFENVPQVGDRLEAIVVRIGGELGLILSVEKLNSLNFQDKVYEYIQNKKIIKGKVLVELPNGYKIQINENVSGFMPFYLSSKSKDEKLKRGSVVEFYILEASEADGLRLILDRRTLEKERDLAKRIELVSSYNEEDVVDGVVERITEYGAIVKIKNFVTGILHKRILPLIKLKMLKILLELVIS